MLFPPSFYSSTISTPPINLQASPMSSRVPCSPPHRQAAAVVPCSHEQHYCTNLMSTFLATYPTICGDSFWMRWTLKSSTTYPKFRSKGERGDQDLLHIDRCSLIWIYPTHSLVILSMLQSIPSLF
jgi:hypothetical protein